MHAREALCQHHPRLGTQGSPALVSHVLELQDMGYHAQPRPLIIWENEKTFAFLLLQSFSFLLIPPSLLSCLPSLDVCEITCELVFIKSFGSL